MTPRDATPETVSLPDADGKEPGPAFPEAAADPVDSEQPPTDPEAGEDSDKPRRRGRRGGRRRRRDEGEQPAAPAEAEPYAGPTPANPYASGIDIFDVMELAEEREAQLAVRVTPAPAPADNATHSAPDLAEAAPLDAPDAEEATGTLEPVAPETVAPGTVTPMATPIEFVPDTKLPAPTPLPSPDPGQAVPAQLAIKATLDLHDATPIPSAGTDQVITEDVVPPPAAEPPAEKRRGWWRR